MAKPIQPHYKNLVIGFGKGGKTLAAWLAKQGEEVALIEKSGGMYGGSCINVACIPTKAMIRNAEKKQSYENAFVQKNELTSFLRQLNFENVDNLDKAQVITGQASFTSPTEICVKLSNSQEEKVVSADRIFINTGSQPRLPSVKGIEKSKRVFTSISLLEQPHLLQQLLIIGGGFIGLEFADMFVKFGAQVTVLEGGDTFLPKEDSDIAEAVQKVLTEKGINIITGVSVEIVEDIADNKVTLWYKNGEGKLIALTADAILIATGRKPMTEGLNLEAAGIKTDSKGYIEVDEFLKTNVPRIWALGDINGGPQFTYISLDDFRIVKNQLAGGSYTSTQQRAQVASSVFITPPLAHIGLREKEAAEKGYQYKVAKLPAAKVVRARIEGNTDGLLKTVVDTKTNQILGCTLFCAGAHEMINTVQVAINGGLHYQQLRDAIYTHPSMTEALNDLYALI